MSLERRGVRETADSRFNRVARDTREAALVLSNGAEIRGTVHLPPGGRLLDLFNLQTEAFVAVTNTRVSSASGWQEHPFALVNKRHIVSATELTDGGDKRAER